MSRDDPFSSQDDGDRTVIRPMPGGRRAGAMPATGGTPSQPPPPRPDVSPPVKAQRWSGLNPLVRCASPLLVAAGQLRSSVAHADPDHLRQHLVQEVRAFESCARARGIAEATVLPARYVLCSLLDEAVLGTPWGSESIWAKQGLLISFHNEAWGGEKFFQALEKLIAYPSGNLHMLELMYLCLSLGFEGRYRVREGGRDQLEMVRERLYQTIRAQRGDPERELSPSWQGVVERRDPLLRTVPLWVFSAVAGVLLLALFAGFIFALHKESDPVYLALANLDVPTVTVERPPAPASERIVPPEPPLTLRILLADEIAAGRLEVLDGPGAGAETVVIHGDDLFGSGKASINKKFLPLLDLIGEKLNQLPGNLLVSGHTDSVPIRTLRFPSNQILSAERAQSVAQRLGEITAEPDRFTPKGFADSRLRVPEDPKHARNRRVEITLRPPSLVERAKD